MDEYVSKPFTIEQLHAALEGCAAGERHDAGVAPPAPLDAKTQERLRTLSARGRSDLLARLAAIYEGSSTDLVNNLRVAARARDAAAIGRAAHALKSSSANVGATTLAATCAEVERAAREGDTDRAIGLVPRLRAEHQEVLAALRETRAAAAPAADGLRRA